MPRRPQSTWIGWSLAACRILLVVIFVAVPISLVQTTTSWHDPLVVSATIAGRKLADVPSPTAFDASLRLVAGGSGAASPIRVDLDRLRMTAVVAQPGALDHLLVDGPRLLGATLLAAGLWLLHRILRRADQGEPFAAGSAHDLRLLGLLVAVGGTTAAIVSAAADRWLVEWTPVGPLAHSARLWTATFLIVGVVLLALSEVWRHGVQLREDLEGTV